MEEVLLQDDWKKEGKRCIYVVVFMTLITVALTVMTLFRPYEDAETDWIRILCFFTPLICIMIYVVTYSYLYKITVTANQIVRKTLFRTKSICFSEIQSYTSKKYSRVSELFEFKFSVNGKAFKIYTHFPDKMEEIFNASREPIESDKQDGETSE